MFRPLLLSLVCASWLVGCSSDDGAQRTDPHPTKNSVDDAPADSHDAKANTPDNAPDNTATTSNGLKTKADQPAKPAGPLPEHVQLKRRADGSAEVHVAHISLVFSSLPTITADGSDIVIRQSDGGFDLEVHATVDGRKRTDADVARELNKVRQAVPKSIRDDGGTIVVEDIREVGGSNALYVEAEGVEDGKAAALVFFLHHDVRMLIGAQGASSLDVMRPQLQALLSSVRIGEVTHASLPPPVTERVDGGHLLRQAPISVVFPLPPLADPKRHQPDDGSWSYALGTSYGACRLLVLKLPSLADADLDLLMQKQREALSASLSKDGKRNLNVDTTAYEGHRALLITSSDAGADNLWSRGITNGEYFVLAVANAEAKATPDERAKLKAFVDSLTTK